MLWSVWGFTWMCPEWVQHSLNLSRGWERNLPKNSSTLRYQSVQNWSVFDHQHCCCCMRSLALTFDSCDIELITRWSNLQLPQRRIWNSQNLGHLWEMMGSGARMGFSLTRKAFIHRRAKLCWITNRPRLRSHLAGKPRHPSPRITPRVTINIHTTKPFIIRQWCSTRWVALLLLFDGKPRLNSA